ncbi:MAG: helix-turn-helix domain-containing protein [Sphingomonadaceae bacterium]
MLLVLPPRRLASLAAGTPGLDAAVTRLAMLNLWTTLSIVSTLRRQSNVERVAALLITLAGADLADGWQVRVAQADLAAMAALGRTTLIEALRELEALGLIDIGYRAVRLRDLAGLMALRDGMAGKAQPGSLAHPIR